MTFTTTVNESYLQWRTRGLISSSVGNCGEICICLATAGVNITVYIFCSSNTTLEFSYLKIRLESLGVVCRRSDFDLGCVNEGWEFVATYCQKTTRCLDCGNLFVLIIWFKWLHIWAKETTNASDLQPYFVKNLGPRC